MEVLNYENLSYVLMKPDKFNENRKYPAILFLHGAGSRGTNVSVIKNNPFCKKMSEKEKKPFMIFCPQCYADSWFSIFEQLLDFTRFVQAHKNVDEKRIYLMGPSMGGYGTWQLAMSAPDVFAAAECIGMRQDLKTFRFGRFTAKTIRLYFAKKAKKWLMP